MSCVQSEIAQRTDCQSVCRQRFSRRNVAAHNLGPVFGDTKQSWYALCFIAAAALTSSSLKTLMACSRRAQHREEMLHSPEWALQKFCSNWTQHGLAVTASRGASNGTVYWYEDVCLMSERITKVKRHVLTYYFLLRTLPWTYSQNVRGALYADHVVITLNPTSFSNILHGVRNHVRDYTVTAAKEAQTQTWVVDATRH